MGSSRQAYWSGLPLSSPGDLPDPGIEPGSPPLQEDSLPSEPPGTPWSSQFTVPDLVCLHACNKSPQMWQPCEPQTFTAHGSGLWKPAISACGHVRVRTIFLGYCRPFSPRPGETRGLRGSVGLLYKDTDPITAGESDHLPRPTHRHPQAGGRSSACEL